MKKKYFVAALLAVIAVFLIGNEIVTVSVAHTVQKEAQSVKIPVLMYHALLKDPARQNEFVISPDLFEQDLAYLTAHGYTTVTVTDLIRFVYDGVPLPEKPIMLSFDDGYYNNYLYAYPLLQKHKMKAVISPIASMTEKYSASGEINAYYTHITYDMIREMTSDGTVEIQNHSYALHKTGAHRHGAAQAVGESDEQYKETLTNDLTLAKKLLFENAQVETTAFFYPFGAVSETSERILKDMGVLATFTCEEKMNTVTEYDPSSLYKIGRFRRRNYQTSDYFFTQIVHLGG